jgi:DNA polymerase-1
MKGKFLHNGRVHTEFHQTRDEEFGTRTGRLSTTGPNMGAMPGKRQGELGKRFREIFIPDDGMEFTEADYNVCEIRICAHYCQARAWLDGFKAGKDPHTAISDALGIQRRHAKTINLALMTGAGKGKIASELGLPLHEGMRVVEQYFDGLPELKEFQRQATRAFESRGFVSTLLGRRLQLANSSKAYTAVNRLTQGGNADIIKSAMVALDKVPNIETMLTVYDSTLFQHEKGFDQARANALQTIVDMKALGIDFSVPMRAEYGSGKDWGQATFTTEGFVEWTDKSK